MLGGSVAASTAHHGAPHGGTAADGQTQAIRDALLRGIGVNHVPDECVGLEEQRKCVRSRSSLESRQMQTRGSLSLSLARSLHSLFLRAHGDGPTFIQRSLNVHPLSATHSHVSSTHARAHTLPYTHAHMHTETRTRTHTDNYMTSSSGPSWMVRAIPFWWWGRGGWEKHWCVLRAVCV